MNTYEIKGTYGSGKTPATILVAERRNGSKWYAVQGSYNVNLTTEHLYNGVDIEELSDIDMFTASAPVESLDDLVREIEN